MLCSDPDSLLVYRTTRRCQAGIGENISGRLNVSRAKRAVKLAGQLPHPTHRHSTPTPAAKPLRPTCNFSPGTVSDEGFAI